MIFRAKITIYSKSGKFSFTEDTFIENEKSEKENAREIFKEARIFYKNLYPDAEIIEYKIERI